VFHAADVREGHVRPLERLHFGRLRTPFDSRIAGQALTDDERLVECPRRLRVHALLVEVSCKPELCVRVRAEVERFLVLQAGGFVVGDGEIRLRELKPQRHVVGKRHNRFFEALDLLERIITELGVRSS
jgi:hypothetical protein